MGCCVSLPAVGDDEALREEIARLEAHVAELEQRLKVERPTANAPLQTAALLDKQQQQQPAHESTRMRPAPFPAAYDAKDLEAFYANSILGPAISDSARRVARWKPRAFTPLATRAASGAYVPRMTLASLKKCLEESAMPTSLYVERDDCARTTWGDGTVPKPSDFQFVWCNPASNAWWGDTLESRFRSEKRIQSRGFIYDLIQAFLKGTFESGDCQPRRHFYFKYVLSAYAHTRSPTCASVPSHLLTRVAWQPSFQVRCDGYR